MAQEPRRSFFQDRVVRITLAALAAFVLVCVVLIHRSDEAAEKADFFACEKARLEIAAGSANVAPQYDTRNETFALSPEFKQFGCDRFYEVTWHKSP
jgi:hypothetical protein